MRNKDFYNLRQKVEMLKTERPNLDYFIGSESNSIENAAGNVNVEEKSLMQDFDIENNIIGNPNWISWLYSNYSLADKATEEEVIYSNLLQSFISGNSKHLESIYFFNVYDWLYTKFLNLFNYKLLQKYLAIEKIDLHFVDNPDLTGYMNANKDNSIEKIILELQSLEMYKNNILNNDFFLDLELEIIKAHFNSDSSEKLTLLEFIIEKTNFYMNEERLNIYVEQQVKNIVPENILKSPDTTNMLSNLANFKQISSLNYWKLTFVKQLGIYLIFNQTFNEDKIIKDSLGELRDAIIINSKNLIRIFFNKIISIVISESIPEVTVYMLGFWNDITMIIESLIDLVSKITNKEDFDKVIKEIDIHFEPYTETINKALANNSKIYAIVFLFFFEGLLILFTFYY